jgi:hypothetical protein
MPLARIQHVIAKFPVHKVLELEIPRLESTRGSHAWAKGGFDALPLVVASAVTSVLGMGKWEKKFNELHIARI